MRNAARAYKKLSQLNYPVKRLLHVGGHYGQEGLLYQENGIEFTFVEPVPEYAAIARNKGYNVLEVAIGKRGNRILKVAGEQSSFLDLPADSKYSVDHEITVKVIPLTDIESGYDTLALDTEGTVLEVLQTSDLPFKTIVLESRPVPYYIGEDSRDEITEYLKKHGYKLSRIYGKNVIYVRTA